jgi:hypothetical protein
MSKVTRAGGERDERDATRDRGLAAWRLPHVVAFPTAIFTFNLHRPKLHWRKKGPVFHPASTIIASHPLVSHSSPHRLLCHRPLHSSTPVLPSSTSFSSPVKIQSPPSSRHITKKKKTINSTTTTNTRLPFSSTSSSSTSKFSLGTSGVYKTIQLKNKTGIIQAFFAASLPA